MEFAVIRIVDNYDICILHGYTNNYKDAKKLKEDVERFIAIKSHIAEDEKMLKHEFARIVRLK